MAAFLLRICGPTRSQSTTFSRACCFMRALNRHIKRVFDLTRKEPHWGRRKLARDR